MSKTWIITGASAGGIGEGIARAVLANGDNAVITARSMAKLETIAKDYPETCLPVTLDMSDRGQMKEVVAKTVEKFGTVDVLINNAGHGYRSSVEEGEDEAIRELFETNLFGPINMIKEVLPIMREKGEGVIMNTTSIAAERSAVGSGYYASSKAALDLLTDGLCIPISWAKAGELTKTVYTTADGKELVVNPGKTYITLVPSDTWGQVAFQ